MTAQVKPYGLWQSPIRVGAMSANHRLYDAKWDDRTGALVWQVRRRSGAALVVQGPNSAPRDLVRDTQVGGGVLFGGGGFCVRGGMACYVGAEGRLYVVPVTGGQPHPITPAFGATASPALSPDGQWVAFVHSYEGRDSLAIVPVDGSQYPQKLLDDTDFVMHPAWHPDGDRLAVITWNHPHMPWDASRLYLLTLDVSTSSPAVMGRHVLAGAANRESIFGASFSPNGEYLAYTSDREGWWQLYLYHHATDRHYRLTTDPAEYGLPAWLQDMRTIGWGGDSQTIYALRNQQSRYTLQRITIATKQAETIAHLDEYTHMEQLAVDHASDTVAIIAGATHLPDRLLTVQPGEKPQIRHYTDTGAIPAAYLAHAQVIRWTTRDGIDIHGLYYPPTNPGYTSEGRPPLIVYIHSGPTRQRFAKYFPEPHFFASRGFAVLEPNYRGSTGYGRDFKNMLHGNWGVVEVEDAVSGAHHLIEQGLADVDRVVVMGESSGGFSVLQSLVQQPGFYCAGVAQAPVADQFSQVMHTHKFERFYNDSLLGPLPQAAAIYRERSPVRHLARIQDPLALFHGRQDSVVPVAQSEQVAAGLRRQGIPHVIRLYDGEGHSFREPATITDYYTTMLQFLLEHVIYI